MLNNKKIVVVLPAYNAAQTLEPTYREIPFDIVDEVVLVDDASRDHTVRVGEALGIRHIVVHEKNTGYGGNQKTCYDKALSLGADIVVMLHPDYQYTPKLIPAMVSIIASDIYPVVLGSRILGKEPKEVVCLFISITSTGCSPFLKTFLLIKSFQNIIPVTGLFQRRYYLELITTQIPMILFSITRCFPRFSWRVSILQRLAVRPSILQKPHQLISAGVLPMDLVYSLLACGTGCIRTKY